MRVITFKLSDDIIEMVDRYALEHKMSRSEVIRLAILRLMRSYEVSDRSVKVRKLAIR